MFLEILQNSQEKTCARVSFFNKVVGLRVATLLKKRLWHSCFPLNFTKFLRTPFLTENTFSCRITTVAAPVLLKSHIVQDIVSRIKLPIISQFQVARTIVVVLNFTKSMILVS